MPLSVVPTSDHERAEPAGSPADGSGPEQTPEGREPERPARSTSRWVDYETHELLEMISELEDERRWARLREGVLWAVLIHILILSSITWIPKYVFRVPAVIDPFQAIQQRKDDLKYLDLPPDLVEKYKPKVTVTPVPKPAPQIDKKTLEAMNKPTIPPPPVPEPKVEEQPKPEPAPPPIPPSPQSQSQLEAPQPRAVPARPNFALNSKSPDEQLREAMRGAERNPGSSAEAPTGGLSQHPGAGGGATIISDTQGVDFHGWLQRWYYETEHTWDPLIPDEVNPPLLKQGQVQIRFKVLPNGRIMDGSMVLEGRSGDTALDRAAWGALTGSSYPPLPRDFHGPFIELRAVFMYNMRPN